MGRGLAGDQPYVKRSGRAGISRYKDLSSQNHRSIGVGKEL